jgi:tRNA U34 5-carboxymethylaminomethyl modifying GTPase MnmE/TrmE
MLVVVVRELDHGLRVSQCVRCVRARMLQAEIGEHTGRSCSMPRRVPLLDVTAARMLAELIDERRERGIRLRIARAVGQVRDVVENRVLTNLYSSVEAAVDAAAGTTRSAHLTRSPSGPRAVCGACGSI